MIAQQSLVLYALREGRDFYEKGSIRDYLVLNSIGNCVVKSVTQGEEQFKVAPQTGIFLWQKMFTEKWTYY